MFEAIISPEHKQIYEYQGKPGMREKSENDWMVDRYGEWTEQVFWINMKNFLELAENPREIVYKFEIAAYRDADRCMEVIPTTQRPPVALL